MISEIVNLGTVATVCFHFVVCGLPLMAALGGSLFNMPAGFTFGIRIPMGVMMWLLIISGIMIVISFITYFRACDCSKKTKKFHKIGLIIVCVLYAAAVTGHLTGHHNMAGHNMQNMENMQDMAGHNMAPMPFAGGGMSCH